MELCNPSLPAIYGTNDFIAVDFGKLNVLFTFHTNVKLSVLDTKMTKYHNLIK